MTKIYLKEIRKFTPLNHEEEKKLFKKAKAGDRGAYELLIKSNLRFVHSIAKGYTGLGLELEELIQEGNIGLLTAYEKFDYKKNFKFITYAVWWIRQSILNALREHSKLIRLPANKISTLSKLEKLKNELESVLNRPPTYDDLLEYTDDPDILNYNFTIIDLDAPQTDNDNNLHNIIPSEENKSIDLEEFNFELDAILDSCSEREKKILKMYYGLGYLRPYTLNEIGDELGLTRERIRQIKEKLIEKIKLMPEAESFKEFFI